MNKSGMVAGNPIQDDSGFQSTIQEDKITITRKDFLNDLLINPLTTEPKKPQFVKEGPGEILSPKPKRTTAKLSS